VPRKRRPSRTYSLSKYSCVNSYSLPDPVGGCPGLVYAALALNLPTSSRALAYYEWRCKRARVLRMASSPSSTHLLDVGRPALTTR
jgi:hypothetical protein